MSKYKLINKQTNQEHLCNKVTIDGFDYYVSNEQAIEGFYGYIDFQGGDIKKVGKHFADDWKKVIATNNPNIDIPKVMDKIENIVKEYVQELIDCKSVKEHERTWVSAICHQVIIKSQETHSFSEEDMIEFAKWLDDNMQQREYYPMSSMNYKELLKIWKEQQPKIVYYG